MEMADCLRVGVDGGHRVLRDLLALLHGPGDAVRRRDGRSSNEFLAGSAHGGCRLAALFGAARPVDVLGAGLILTGNLLNLKAMPPIPSRASTGARRKISAN